MIYLECRWDRPIRRVLRLLAARADPGGLAIRPVPAGRGVRAVLEGRPVLIGRHKLNVYCKKKLQLFFC